MNAQEQAPHFTYNNAMGIVAAVEERGERALSEARGDRVLLMEFIRLNLHDPEVQILDLRLQEALAAPERAPEGDDAELDDEDCVT